MPSLADIRAAVAAALETIPGTQVTGYSMSAPTPPCFFVQPDDDLQDEISMVSGYARWNLKVTALVGIPGDVGAQKNLDEYCSPTGDRSVRAILETDRTLGGVAETLAVRAATGYRVFQRDGGGATLGAEWPVTVYTRGDN